MMKKIAVISFFVLAIIAWGCNGGVQRKPGRTYMPDMAYSRAYETYADHDTLLKQGINYTAIPVEGTIKRGALFPFAIRKGDSINYIASKQVVNPLPPLSGDSLKEAERLYLVNCAICHGAKLDGNGPLYKDGNGPYSAAPRSFMTDPLVINMPDGQMFYSVTYGKGQMGSYASQLNTTQRWMVIQYIKKMQSGGKTPAAPPASTTLEAVRPTNTVKTADTATKK